MRTSKRPVPDGAPGDTSEDPRVARSRAAILDAAARLFIERGYLATSLDDVARLADVAKRTIYNVHGSKEALFREVLREALDTAERFAREVIAPLEDRDDVSTALSDTAARLAHTVLAGRVISLRRLLIAEARRFPDLAADYYERAPGRTIAAIAQALEQFRQRGLLDIEDPALAAEQFAFLVLGASLDRAMFDPLGRALTDREIEARARAGVDTFLRACEGPGPGDRRRYGRGHG